MNTNYEAIILCGGDAWRLKPDTWVPKPMLQFGSLNLLEYQIRWLMRNGIKHIVIASDKEYSIRDALLEYVTWSIELFSRGTGGAVMIAVDKLNNSKLPFYVMNVDDICFFNPVEAIYPEPQAKIIVSKPRLAYGAVKLRQELVLGFREKPYSDDYVSCGHYVFKKHIVDQYFPDNGNLEYEALPKLAEERILQNHRISKWMTINTYKDYLVLKDILEEIK